MIYLEIIFVRLVFLYVCIIKLTIAIFIQNVINSAFPKYHISESVGSVKLMELDVLV